MLEYVVFRRGLKVEFLYLDGILLLSASLPAQRILQIIGMFLGGDEKTE